MSVVDRYLGEVVRSFGAVVDAGAPLVGSGEQAAALVEVVERVRRLAAVATVDVLDQIDASRAFDDHGHANARVMFAHVAGVSGGEAARLDKIRRMVAVCDELADCWRGGGLSVDKACLLARAFSNPRTRDRFLTDQKWFLKQCNKFGYVRLRKVVARWVEVHDDDGREPAPDLSFETRNVSFNQDFFSKGWKLDAGLGSLQGSEFNEIFCAYVEAEFAYDWAAAERVHGADTCRELLARTDAQRRADALCQMAADAANSDQPSAPVKRVHNIVWNAETYEALLARWATGVMPLVDPDRYQVSDIDGHPIAAGAAFVDSLISAVRRVVASAAGVTINMSTTTRLFAGLARHGVTLTTDECYWPGCHIPTSRCQIDHLRPAARGGPTDQSNGLPCCQRHNRLKQRGYVVLRQPDGAITITTPNGDNIG